MKYIQYIIIGIVFGILMTKAEIISWFRIQEMFRFQSFHMYGVIGSALVVGISVTQFFKRKNIKALGGQPMKLAPKSMSFARYILGGTIFGLGWALTGACPGPMFTLLGNGYAAILIVIASAILGTLLYGILKDRLPH